MADVIQVSTRWGRDTVECRRVGPFAIHRTISGPGHTLTHAKTGYAIAEAFRSTDYLERLAAAIEPLADWDFFSTSAVNIWPTALRDQLRGLVRSFKRDDELAAKQERISPTPSEGE